MSIAAWYLQKMDQCARLAKETSEPRERSRFESERTVWLQLLAQEIGMDEPALENVVALEPTSGKAH